MGIIGAQGALPLEPRPAGGPGRGLAPQLAEPPPPLPRLRPNSILAALAPTPTPAKTPQRADDELRSLRVAQLAAVRLDEEHANNSRRVRSRMLAPAKPVAAAKCDKTSLSKIGEQACAWGTPPRPPCLRRPGRGLASRRGFPSSTSSRGRRACRGSSAQTILEPPPRLPRSSDRRAPLCGRSGRWYERCVAKARRAGCNCARNRSY